MLRVLQEKTRLLSAVTDRESQLSASVAEQQQLEAQVAVLESRLLCGGKNIIDHTNEQQRELEQQKEQLTEQKVLLLRDLTNVIF